MSVSCECSLLSGRGLCDELIIRPEEPYRLWCVVVCDLQTSKMRRPWPAGGCCAKRKSRKLKNLWSWNQPYSIRTHPAFRNHHNGLCKTWRVYLVF